MNLPTHVSICWSLMHIRKMNLSSSVIWMKFGAMCDSFENRFSLSAWLILHSMRKCLSSSRIWQKGQLRSSNFVLGRVYLPYSIARVCELVRSCDMVLDSIQICFHAKVRLNVTIGSQDRVNVKVLNLFCPYIDEPIRDSHFTFRFEFRSWTINIKKICIDHFANMTNPCREAQLTTPFYRYWKYAFAVMLYVHENGESCDYVMKYLWGVYPA